MTATAFYQPHTDNHSLRKYVRSFTPFLCLVLGLLDELGLDSVGACDLDSRSHPGTHGVTRPTYLLPVVQAL